jgi:small-conductance mechanosensitive channel
MDNTFAAFYNWIELNSSRLVISLVILSAYLVIRRLIIPKLQKLIERDRLKNKTLKDAVFSLNLFIGVLAFLFILFTWGFNFGELLALSTGLVAITGVALFANWSILSNITAFFILVAHQSYQRGNYIRIIDMDNYIEGYISEINLFNTRLIGENREVITYPNNLLIARPVIINPRTRHVITGKIQDLSQAAMTDGDG